MPNKYLVAPKFSPVSKFDVLIKLNTFAEFLADLCALWHGTESQTNIKYGHDDLQNIIHVHVLSSCNVLKSGGVKRYESVQYTSCRA